MMFPTLSWSPLCALRRTAFGPQVQSSLPPEDLFCRNGSPADGSILLPTVKFIDTYCNQMSLECCMVRYCLLAGEGQMQWRLMDRRR